MFCLSTTTTTKKQKKKREKVCMKTNDGERLVRKPEKHIRHLVLNARDLPRHLAFDLALETGSSVGNATLLALLRHFLAFTSIRRAGQRTSGAWSYRFSAKTPPRWPWGKGVRLGSGRCRVRIPLAPAFFRGRVIPVT